MEVSAQPDATIYLSDQDDRGSVRATTLPNNLGLQQLMYCICALTASKSEAGMHLYCCLTGISSSRRMSWEINFAETIEKHIYFSISGSTDKSQASICSCIEQTFPTWELTAAMTSRALVLTPLIPYNLGLDQHRWLGGKLQLCIASIAVKVKTVKSAV